MDVSMNKVILIGRLGRDPELKFTSGGEPLCNFSLATSRSWNNATSGERQEVTEWHNVVAWRKLAEQCNGYLSKGRLVFIEGRVETHSWDDKETGKKMYRTEVVAETMVMLDPKPTGEPDDGYGEVDERPALSRPGSAGLSREAAPRFSGPPGSRSRSNSGRAANISSFPLQGEAGQANRSRPITDPAPIEPFDDDDSLPF